MKSIIQNNKYKIFYFLIIVAILFIIFLVIKIYSDYNSIINFNDDLYINLIGTYSTIIIGLLSFIGVMINLIHNNKLIDMSEESKFVELRFETSKKAIYELIIFIQMTLAVYKDLKDFYKSDHFFELKNIYLDPKSFLMMQFVEIISKTTLLNDLPLNVRKELECKFEKKLNYQETYNSKKDLDKILNYKNIHLIFIPHFKEYNKFINDFREDSQFNNKFSVFKYYHSSNISEEEILNHFLNILNIIGNSSVEELIIRDYKLRNK